jgi:hypothetical protein
LEWGVPTDPPCPPLPRYPQHIHQNTHTHTHTHTHIHTSTPPQADEFEAEFIEPLPEPQGGPAGDLAAGGEGGASWEDGGPPAAPPVDEAAAAEEAAAAACKVLVARPSPGLLVRGYALPRQAAPHGVKLEPAPGAGEAGAGVGEAGGAGGLVKAEQGGAAAAVKPEEPPEGAAAGSVRLVVALEEIEDGSPTLAALLAGTLNKVREGGQRFLGGGEGGGGGRGLAGAVTAAAESACNMERAWSVGPATSLHAPRPPAPPSPPQHTHAPPRPVQAVGLNAQAGAALSAPDGGPDGDAADGEGGGGAGGDGDGEGDEPATGPGATPGGGDGDDAMDADGGGEGGEGGALAGEGSGALESARSGADVLGDGPGGPGGALAQPAKRRRGRPPGPNGPKPRPEKLVALWRSGRERAIWLREARRAAAAGSVGASAYIAWVLTDRAWVLLGGLLRRRELAARVGRAQPSAAAPPHEEGARAWGGRAASRANGVGAADSGGGDGGPATTVCTAPEDEHGVPRPGAKRLRTVSQARPAPAGTGPGGAGAPRGCVVCKAGAELEAGPGGRPRGRLSLPLEDGGAGGPVVACATRGCGSCAHEGCLVGLGRAEQEEAPASPGGTPPAPGRSPQQPWTCQRCVQRGLHLPQGDLAEPDASPQPAAPAAGKRGRAEGTPPETAPPERVRATRAPSLTHAMSGGAAGRDASAERGERGGGERGGPRARRAAAVASVAAAAAAVGTRRSARAGNFADFPVVE